MGFMIRRSEIITTYSHLKIACGCYAKSLLVPRPASPAGFGLPVLHFLPRHMDQQHRDATPCSILTDRGYACHTLALCVSLRAGVQAKFMFLGEFWSELTKMSKAEESAAEQRLVNYKARL